MRWRIAFVVLLLCSGLATSCTLATPATTNAPSPAVDSTPSASFASESSAPTVATPTPILATPTPTAYACPAALLTGFLVAQGDELVVVRDPLDGSMSVEHLIWLPGEYQVGAQDGGLVVRDAGGVVRAHETDHVQLAGGEITTPGVWTVCGGALALKVDQATPKLPFGQSAIDAARAVQLSREHVSPDMSTLSRVQVGRFSALNTSPNIGPGEDIQPDDLVWAVLFTGQVTICPHIASVCESPRPGQVTVFLDYSTGEYREVQGFSPG